MENIVVFKNVLRYYLTLFTKLDNRLPLTTQLQKIFEHSIVYFNEASDEFFDRVNKDKELLDSWIVFCMLVRAEIKDIDPIITELDKVLKEVVVSTPFEKANLYEITGNTTAFVILFGIRAFGDDIFSPLIVEEDK